MADLTITIDADTYETMVSNSTADFAAIEPHVHGGVKTAVLRLHSRAVYIRDLVDAQNGIVRPLDGDPKPGPNP
jgi:hypothetical protein